MDCCNIACMASMFCLWTHSKLNLRRNFQSVRSRIISKLNVWVTAIFITNKLVARHLVSDRSTVEPYHNFVILLQNAHKRHPIARRPWGLEMGCSAYNDVMMSAMASQITGVSIVCSSVGSGADQRKHQSSASLAFVWGIHRSPVDSPHKGPVMWKMFPLDVIMICSLHVFIFILSY